MRACGVTCMRAVESIQSTLDDSAPLPRVLQVVTTNSPTPLSACNPPSPLQLVPTCRHSDRTPLARARRLTRSSTVVPPNVRTERKICGRSPCTVNIYIRSKVVSFRSYHIYERHGTCAHTHIGPIALP